MTLQTVEWTPRLLFDHDPDAIEVYRVDWSEWLDGETLVQSAVFPTEINAVIVASTTTTVDIRVSGGALNATAEVTVRADSSGGRRQDRTLRFRVLRR